jgi:hypothetical protein
MWMITGWVDIGLQASVQETYGGESYICDGCNSYSIFTSFQYKGSST